MWECKNCGGTNIGKLNSGTFNEYQCDLDENGYGVEDSYDEEIQETRYDCNDCGDSGYDVEDIAEWKEEENV